ncbi:transketolase [Candidatus Dependentiae bacterium]
MLKKFLEKKAYNMRESSLVMTSLAGSGHPTTCLSAADIVSVLFFYEMRYDPNSPIFPNNDRFILSKGHAAPLLYAAWKEVGVLTQEDLYNYRKIDSVLEGHPTMRFAHTEAATGALGIGLSIGVGQALTAKLDDLSFKTYVLLGDSEVAEGAIWEAAELAHYYKLNNLIAILDCNRLGQSTETIHGHHVKRYQKKFEAFGWKTMVIDGHDVTQIMESLDKAQESKDLPVMIIAKTFKGHGVKRVENKLGYHGKAFSKEELNEVLKELEEKYAKIIKFDESEYEWRPKLPDKPSVVYEDNMCASLSLEPPKYEIGKEIATRKVYGQALAKLGNKCKSIVSLDAEVKNSTFAEIFEEAHPDRFFQCFIAEQNMIGMATGMDARGKIPFASTFSAFMTRAHDQIRMAAIGEAKLRLVGSHAGVSIGQDGPSQMGLEDIAMMRCLPKSVVLYPCDAVSAYKLVQEMSHYTQGISYLRTTRMATPVIYEPVEKFTIGGCKVLRQNSYDKACIVAAGITLVEALKAYDKLQEDGITVSVIDLYSIKPLDRDMLIQVAQKSENKIITVEDHYIQGGLGEAVCAALSDLSGKDCILVEKLAVTKLPMSGKPEQLLAWAGIDASSIVKKVKSLLSA